jgi:class 3 adenylate cyclase
LEYLSQTELQALLKKIHDELIRIAEASGGILNDFSGEEYTVIFGIPSADEHDFIRAAHAANLMHAAIQQAASEYESRIGNPVTAQSGIAAGLVVVRPSDSSDRKYELTGNAVQIASTLASHAEPGEVWITEEGRRTMDRFFETESCEEIRIKGAARKLKPYRIAAESAHSRFDVWQKEELSAYTGRQKELEALQDKLQNASGGDGQFVAVIGEAGSGKSRLLYEFRRSLDRDSLRILQGGSSLYSSNVAYSPFIEVLKEDLKLREKGNSEETVVEQIKQLNPSLVDFMPVYLHLLAIPTSKFPLPKHLQGKELQLAITEALCAYMFSKKDGAVLLLLEDWHAADEASRHILEQLQEMIPGYPILIVATCRPECSFRAAAHHTTL